MTYYMTDGDLCKELSQNIEKLTHSGGKSLDEKTLKEVKNVCKLSDSYVEHAYHLIMHQLEKNHAEVRFSAFQLCIEIFQRSHMFRKLLVSNLQHLLELTVETCPELPLPPPRSVALSLKRLALQTMLEWNKTFGKKYKELQLAFNFLKQRKKVDFTALELETAAERASQQETERRVNLRNEQNVKKVSSEVKELEPEILASVAALKNCISLLLPPPDEFFVHDEESEQHSGSNIAGVNTTGVMDGVPCSRPDDDGNIVRSESEGTHRTDNVGCASDDSESEDEHGEDIDLRRHGMFGASYNIEIKLHPGDENQVKVTEENSVIVDNARDHFILINKRYLPCVRKWIIILNKSSGLPDYIKKIISLKQSLEEVVTQFLKLKLEKIGHVNSEESSDSDFEDVAEKDGYEETAKTAPVPAVKMPSPSKTVRKQESFEWNIAPREHEKDDPTTAQSTISMLLATRAPSSSWNMHAGSIEKQPESSSTCSVSSVDSPSLKMSSLPSTSQTGVEDRKARLLAIAPKLPYDIDLYHWEDENLTAPTMLAVKAENSRFWSSTNIDEIDEVPVPEGSACLRTRVIEFTGQFEPVTRACRAPLGNGKLCPRHDRFKCPFHGSIVERDELGICVNPEDEKQLVKTSDGEVQSECPDWQDPQLLAELKKTTGIDLKMPEKKRGKKKKQKKVKETKYPGLTDLKVKQNTVVNRLSKKIFKKSTMKRVACAMDRQDRKKFCDKFGDQFNYMF